MGAKQTTNNISNDKKKLGAFYRPELTDERVNSIEAKLKKGRSKFFIRGIVCGFLFEYFIGVSTPFEKINKRSVMRRLSNFLLI